MVDPDFVPDYLSGNQAHYSFIFVSEGVGYNKCWDMNVTFAANYGPCVSTQEKWEEAAALLTERGVE